MPAQEVTTGTELNSYKGDSGLGTGEGDGYAKLDLSPLHDYALKKYETHLTDYKQQQDDKAALLKQFNDPNLYQFVDKSLADQLDPDMQELQSLMEKNVQMKPNSTDWYRIHELHNKLIEKNANAKTVQTLKDQYKKSAGESADPHEKERMNDYVAQLDKYKIGDDIPAYNKYFAFDEKALPELSTATGTKERIGKDGNVEKVQYNIYNPLDGVAKAKDQAVRDPKVAQTGIDIAHTLLTHGGIDTVNAAMADTYDKGMRYNMGLLREKYNKEFEAYKKTNPGANFEQFSLATGTGMDELQAIKDGHKYLSEKNQLQYIPAAPGEKLPGYTYSDDGKMRLNVDDDTLRAIYAATRNTPGPKETVIESKVSKLPFEIAKLKAQTATVAPESQAKIGALHALTAQRLASSRYTDKKAGAIDKMVNPIQTFDEMFKGKIKVAQTQSGLFVPRVNAKDMSPDFEKNSGLLPINPQGDYNIVPANIVTAKGVQVDEGDAQKLYHRWLAEKPQPYEGAQLPETADSYKMVYKGGKWNYVTKDKKGKEVLEVLKTPEQQKSESKRFEKEGVNEATDMEDRLKQKPSIFHFMYAKGVNFEYEMEGHDAKDPSKLKRSNRFQSWTNQTKDMKATAAKLLMDDSAPGEGGTANDDKTPAAESPTAGTNE